MITRNWFRGTKIPARGHSYLAVEREVIARNLARVRERIAAAAQRAGREAAAVRLVAVTKSVGIEEIRSLIALGQIHLGENRVETAGEKIAAANDRAVWHMIGNIQRRKAGEVVQLFDRIDAVDRVKLAEALDKKCAEVGKEMPVLLEVNVSGEEAKHGVPLAEAPAVVDAIRGLAHLKLEGVMTMAPFVEDT
ncbi:MAG: YggS family pyridoxal phosphate-dependent enzyme, partial [Candidatus Hydrogenedentales bacterium]